MFLRPSSGHCTKSPIALIDTACKAFKAHWGMFRSSTESVCCISLGAFCSAFGGATESGGVGFSVIISSPTLTKA